MFCFSKRINKKYGMDISGLHFIRRFKDGISFFEVSINLDLYKGDHNPHFRIMLLILNFKVFEFEIYNAEHAIYREEAFEELRKELETENKQILKNRGEL